MNQKKLDDFQSSGVECVSCSREFETEYGMKQHHAKSHGEKLGKKTSECVVCGDDFEYNAAREDRKTCGRECMGKYRTENFTGEKHHNHKEAIELSCAECSDRFTVKPSRKHKAKYCSHDCYAKSIEGQEPHNPRKQITCDCAYCGESVQRPSWWIEKVERSFCSDECEYNWKSENTRGEDHPRWKGGGNVRYGRNWSEKRMEAVRRDNYECWFCGVSNGAHKVAYSQAIHVHHVKPKRDGGSNELHNLITLCAVCHRSIE